MYVFCNFICYIKLVEINPDVRLGANDIQEIFDHPFFNGVDWEAIKHTKQEKPPHKPKTSQTNFNLANMAIDTLADEQSSDAIDEEDQKLFEFFEFNCAAKPEWLQYWKSHTEGKSQSKIQKWRSKLWDQGVSLDGFKKPKSEFDISQIQNHNISITSSLHKQLALGDAK